VFIFASKSFAAVREAFSNTYPDKMMHRLVTKFRVDACLREVGGYFQHLLFCKFFLRLKIKRQLVSLGVFTSPKLTNTVVVTF
jgi:hypothetical protein